MEYDAVSLFQEYPIFSKRTEDAIQLPVLQYRPYLEHVFVRQDKNNITHTFCSNKFKIAAVSCREH
jgi:hypothetical protein